MSVWNIEIWFYWIIKITHTHAHINAHIHAHTNFESAG